MKEGVTVTRDLAAKGKRRGSAFVQTAIIPWSTLPDRLGSPRKWPLSITIVVLLLLLT
jgi:hypothetical protein